MKRMSLGAKINSCLSKGTIKTFSRVEAVEQTIAWYGSDNPDIYAAIKRVNQAYDSGKYLLIFTPFAQFSGEYEQIAQLNTFPSFIKDILIYHLHLNQSK